MADVLLLNSPVRDPMIDAHARASPPLGLASIAAVLQKDGFQVAALDLNVCSISPEEALRETLLTECPEVVGISSATESYPRAVQLAGAVKGMNRDVLTVIGGPHVTFLPHEALNSGFLDVVVRGEGEETLRQITRSWIRGGKKLDEISGIWFRRNGSIHKNPDRHLITDLDAMPIPERQLFPVGKYQYPGNLVTARGCPARCIFCAAPALSGGRYRVRSPQRVVEEMEHLVADHGLKRLTIVDDTFTVFRKRTEIICDMVEERKLPLRWGCCTRANCVTPKLLMKMRQAGCEEIQFGVESGSEIVLASLGKAITLKHVRQAVEWAKGVGMDITCSFMLPHPLDTKATIQASRDMMRELVKKGIRVSIAVTTPFPGTELWKNASHWGIEIHARDWFDYDACTPVFSTPNLSRKDISLIVTDLLYKGP